MRTELAAIVGRLTLAAAAVALFACNNDLCVRHSDCDPGLVCSATGACLAPVEPDGGAPDAGLDATADAPDAATDAAVDAPALDAPVPCGGTIGPPCPTPDAAPVDPTLDSPFARDPRTSASPHPSTTGAPP